MCNGVRESTNAGKDIYGSSGTRLMCWAQTYSNIVPRLSALKKLNKKLQLGLLHNIFNAVCNMLEDKYILNTSFLAWKVIVFEELFAYFRDQWGPESHVKIWCEGAHPWYLSNYQGMEGTNKAIKKDHTFKRRCPREVPLKKFLVKIWNQIL